MGRVEYLYVDQEAVLAAGVLDMPRAMNVIEKARSKGQRKELSL